MIIFILLAQLWNHDNNTMFIVVKVNFKNLNLSKIEYSIGRQVKKKELFSLLKGITIQEDVIGFCFTFIREPGWDKFSHMWQTSRLDSRIVCASLIWKSKWNYPGTSIIQEISQCNCWLCHITSNTSWLLLSGNLDFQLFKLNGRPALVEEKSFLFPNNA